MNLRQQLELSAAHKEAFEAGKQAAAEKIFADIDKLHLHVANEDIDKLHLHVANEYEARAYENLKKKYGVN